MALRKERKKRVFGNHFVQWDYGLNKITIFPQHSSRVTPYFGLGNSSIRLNTDNLPSKIVQPITGETTAEGITPTSPFGLKRWFSMPHTMSNKPVLVIGFNGWSKTLVFPQAGGGSVKEVTATQIVQNGYGCETIHENLRLER